MEASNISDFNLSSEGHCFFCLQNILVKVKPDSEKFETSQLQKCSVHCLARYLEMDMGKVLIEEGQRDSALLAKVRKSRLKVELCEKCTSLNRTFSGLYRQLEKLEIEIKSSLRLIQEEFMGVDRTEQHRDGKKLRLNYLMSNELSQIVDVLREEAIQKCSQKLRFVLPRVGLEKLTKKQIRAKLSKHSTTNSESTKLEPEDFPSEKIIESEGNAKAEFEPPSENLLSDDDIDMDNEGMDFQDNDTPDVPRVRVNDKNLTTEPEINTTSPAPVVISTFSTASTATNNIEKGNHSVNPKTGKWKCSACPMELTSKLGIDFHYQSVHQKIRYRCVPCGKEFVHKHTYNRHHQNVHVGIKFQCLVCNKLFPRKDTLRLHQRVSDCGNGSG